MKGLLVKLLFCDHKIVYNDKSFILTKRLKMRKNAANEHVLWKLENAKKKKKEYDEGGLILGRNEKKA